MRIEIKYKGKSYSDVNEMPPEVRAQYEQLIGVIDRDRNGVPDILEHGGGLVKIVMQLFRLMSIKGQASVTTSIGAEPLSRNEHASERGTGKLEGASFGRFILFLVGAALVALWYFI